MKSSRVQGVPLCEQAYSPSQVKCFNVQLERKRSIRYWCTHVMKVVPIFGTSLSLPGADPPIGQQDFGYINRNDAAS